MQTILLIIVTVPNTVIPAIVLIPHQSEYAVGNNITLSCSVNYSFPHDLDTNLTIQWLNSSSYILLSITNINNYTEHTLNYTIYNSKLSDAGQYTCSFFITTSITNPFISTSNKAEHYTDIAIESNNNCLNIIILLIVLYFLIHSTKCHHSLYTHSSIQNVP